MNEFNKNIRPTEYLAHGLVDDDGNIRERINGEYSLAVAYQLRDDGYQPEEISQYRERFASVVEPYVGTGPIDATAAIPDEAKSAIEEAADRFHDDCEIFEELIHAAAPDLTNWGSFAHLLGHMERINAQLAMLTAYNQD